MVVFLKFICKNTIDFNYFVIIKLILINIVYDILILINTYLCFSNLDTLCFNYYTKDLYYFKIHIKIILILLKIIIMFYLIRNK